MTKRTYGWHVGQLPIDEKPWRIISKDGFFLKDKNGKSRAFDTAEEAEEWLKKSR